jgi:hypothetical protein
VGSGTRPVQTQYLIFPEMKLRGLVPVPTSMLSVSNLYIPTIGPPIWLKQKSGPNVGKYKSLTDT